MRLLVMPIKQCALCRQVKELELSHIVPNFVIRCLKKTSVEAIRNLENPDRVVQDVEKHYLLLWMNRKPNGFPVHPRKGLTLKGLIARGIKERIDILLD